MIGPVDDHLKLVGTPQPLEPPSAKPPEELEPLPPSTWAPELEPVPDDELEPVPPPEPPLPLALVPEPELGPAPELPPEPWAEPDAESAPAPGLLPEPDEVPDPPPFDCPEGPLAQPETDSTVDTQITADRRRGMLAIPLNAFSGSSRASSWPDASCRCSS
jgi:hypothetical protein